MSQELATYADQLERQFANANMAGIAVAVRVKDPEFLIELMRKSAGMLEEAEKSLQYCVDSPLSGWTMAQAIARATLSKIRGE